MAKVKITPLDLRNQEFGRTLRGYDPEEIRVFLELVSDEYEFLIKENTHLTERVRDLDEKIKDYRNMEKTLNATLISAQKNAESYSENARKEADLTIENARLESRRMLESASDEKSALEEEIARLQKIRQFHIKKLKSFLKEQLELLAEEDNPVPSENTIVENDIRVEEVSTPASEAFHPTFSVDEEIGAEHDGDDTDH